MGGGENVGAGAGAGDVAAGGVGKCWLLLYCFLSFSGFFIFFQIGEDSVVGDPDADVGVVFNDDDGAVGGVAAIRGAERDPVRELVEYYGKFSFGLF